MATILIESNDKLLNLFIELANRTGAKVKKLSKQEQMEFQTGERLKAEKSGTRISKSEVMEILRQKQK
jgi:tRNA threonylcarbamoyladenosine modification (KEOPS) complex Cgi121 subunit